MKKTDLAYIAGIVDGEGCIGIYKRNNTKKTKVYQLCVQVTNTNEWIIRWLQMAYGAYSYKRNFTKSDTIKNRKPLYSWTIVGYQALAFLESIYPYLRIKKPQAEIAIQFQKNRPRDSNLVTEKVKAVLEAQRILISNLKHSE